MSEHTSELLTAPVPEWRIGRSVSLDHAAEILGVSRRTIYNRIRDGRLQTIRTRLGSQRVLTESVVELLQVGAREASRLDLIDPAKTRVPSW